MMTNRQLFFQHILLISVASILLSCLIFSQETAAYKKRAARSAYQNPYWKYTYGQYGWKNKIKPKRPKGQCNASAPIFLNGTDPIKTEAAKGNTVLLYMSKTTDRQHYSLWQLPSLNNLAKWYRITGQKVTFIVINHKNTRIPVKAFTTFRHLKFYQEPKNKPSIFKKLNGRYRDVIVYDKCARQQYRIGYPFSSLRYQFVNSAVHNTHYFWNKPQFCGPCKKKPEERNPGDAEEKPGPEEGKPEVNENNESASKPEASENEAVSKPDASENETKPKAVEEAVPEERPPTAEEIAGRMARRRVTNK